MEKPRRKLAAMVLSSESYISLFSDTARGSVDVDEEK